jgi:hypothetical protein
MNLLNYMWNFLYDISFKKILDPRLRMEHTTYDGELRSYDTATTNLPLASVRAYAMCTLDRPLHRINRINKARLGEG